MCGGHARISQSTPADASFLLRCDSLNLSHAEKGLKPRAPCLSNTEPPAGH